jgi:mRNA interferase RelE/StbE
MKLVLTPAALDDLARLPINIRRRIMNKMEWFADQDNPLSFAEPLKDKTLGSHRFRVGDYRVLVDVKQNCISILFVLTIRHRKDVYRL